MFKTLNLSVLVISLVLGSSGLSAQSYVDKHDAKIKSVYINSGGEMLITVEGVSGWLKIGKAGEPTADAMYSSVLAAKMSGSMLWIRYILSDAGHAQVGIVNIK